VGAGLRANREEPIGADDLPTADLWRQFQISGQSLRSAPAPDIFLNQKFRAASALAGRVFESDDDSNLEKSGKLRGMRPTSIQERRGVSPPHYLQGICQRPDILGSTDMRRFYTKLLASMEKQEYNMHHSQERY